MFQLALLVSGRLLDIAQTNFEEGIYVSINIFANLARSTTNNDMHTVIIIVSMQSPEFFVAGSTLLRILEDFALNNHDAVHSLVQTDNISKIS